MHISNNEVFDISKIGILGISCKFTKTDFGKLGFWDFGPDIHVNVPDVANVQISRVWDFGTYLHETHIYNISNNTPCFVTSTDFSRIDFLVLSGADRDAGGIATGQEGGAERECHTGFRDCLFCHKSLEDGRIC